MTARHLTKAKNAQYDFNIDDSGINSTLVGKGPSAVVYWFRRWIVRRLTPLECERLQGYPDGWTDIGEERERIIWRKTDRRGNILEEQVEVVKYYIDSNGKRRKTSDSARYRALGNSIAIPPWTWVLSRLSAFCGCEYLKEHDDKTMASLFDGIGGFPLIWERLNGKGSCIWASEIDEFCVAVTTAHFG